MSSPPLKASTIDMRCVRFGERPSVKRGATGTKTQKGAGSCRNQRLNHRGDKSPSQCRVNLSIRAHCANSVHTDASTSLASDAMSKGTDGMGGGLAHGANHGTNRTAACQVKKCFGGVKSGGESGGLRVQSGEWRGSTSSTAACLQRCSITQVPNHRITQFSPLPAVPPSAGPSPSRSSCRRAGR